uniref:Oxidation resistance protein 1 n=1 Tax=Hirondellea gigas TaxID=1518452 RepID=A0A6A7FQF4_9CRUS
MALVEVGPMSEELRRALYSSTSLNSLDVETFLPDMLDPSEILDHQTYKNLYRKLPARLQGYSWRLTFSTSQQGFSLSSLYRKMQEIVDTPIMVVIQDTQQTVFGSLLSNSVKVSEGFYGTGESFIFTCHPKFEVCNWTGENTYFIKGNNESLVIGGGENFGIWLDGDLYRGRSQPCKTYNNPVLGPSEDFVIKAIECWGFV